MIYALKLLSLVLVAAIAAAMVLRPAFASLMSPTQYKRAWTSLIVLTIIAFLSMRPELYILLVAVAGSVAARQLGEGDIGKVNAFLLLLLALPPIAFTLGGLEGLNYILRLEHVRALSIVLFTIPALRLMMRRRTAGEPSMRVIDAVVLVIQLWDIALAARYASLTGLFRSIVEAFYDILVPYYVITRTLRTPARVREAAWHLMLGCMFVACIAYMESLVQRNLYGGLQWIYGVRWESTVDLMRGGFLRVEATTPQPIVLAFVLMFGIGLWSWLKGDVPRTKWLFLGYAILAAALVSTWSRGPWLGAGVLVAALALQRWLPPKAFAVVTLLGLLGAVVLKASGGDAVVMSALTAVFGHNERDLATITYRRELLDASLAMIKQSPWVGVPNYEAALQGFKQGEGLIDLVNTYVVIMINAGVIGLVLFLFPYVYLVGNLLRLRSRERPESKAVLGKFAPAFIATILAMLFTIFTTSNIDVMRYVLGLAVSLPAIWLAVSRQGVAVAEEPQPETRPTDPLVARLAMGAHLHRR